MHSIQISPKSRSLIWSDDLLPPPEPKSDEIRIKVYAAGVNRADLTQRDGLYPPPEGSDSTLGLECAGIVDALGDCISDFRVGDPVCALLSGGGYAEYVCVPAVQALPVPSGLSFTQAAAIPEVFATVWQNIFIDAGLKSGESVLIHAGGSGVGTAAIQLCNLFGASVYATLRDENKIGTCLDLGAQHCFLSHKGSLRDALLDWTQQQGVDVILDPVGADYLSDNLILLKQDGRLCMIGGLGGMRAEIDLRHVLVKRLRLQGNMLRPGTPADKQKVLLAMHAKVWPLFESGALEPVIDRVFPIAHAMDALDYLASNKTLGKLVLEISTEPDCH